MKRVITVILVLCLAIGMLAGCTSERPTQESTHNAGAQAESTQNTGTEENAFEKQIKFSYMSMWEVQDASKNELYQYITKKFNVDIELITMTRDNYKEKINIAVSSGDMPDVLYNMNNLSDYPMIAKSGAVRAIPDFFDNYPNLKKLKDDMTTDDKKMMIGGKLYGWPGRVLTNPYNRHNEAAILYRTDWAEKVGMKDITDKGVLTIDQLIALAKAFIDQDPGQNGVGKTVGYYGESWAFPGAAGPDLISPYYTSYKLVDGKYVWGPTLPDTLEAVKVAKRMYDSGVVYQDFFSAKSDDGIKMFCAGTMGLFFTNATLGTIEAYKKQFKAANPTLDEDKLIGEFTVTAPDGKIKTQQLADYYAITYYNKNMSDETLERIFTMMDWLAGDEGTKYCAYGIKGKDWSETNGTVTLNWEKNDQGALIKPDYADAANALRSLALCGGDIDFMLPSVRPGSLASYKKLADIKSQLGDMKVADDFLGALTAETAPLFKKFSGFSADTKNQVTKIMVSSVDAEAEWIAYIKSMEAQVNPIVDELNKLYGLYSAGR